MLTKQSMIDVKIQQMTKFKLLGLLENNLNCLAFWKIKCLGPINLGVLALSLSQVVNHHSFILPVYHYQVLNQSGC